MRTRSLKQQRALWGEVEEETLRLFASRYFHSLEEIQRTYLGLNRSFDLLILCLEQSLDHPLLQLHFIAEGLIEKSPELPEVFSRPPFSSKKK